MGHKNWTGRFYRQFKVLGVPGFLVGAALAFSYTFLIDTLNWWYQGDKERPHALNHTIALSVIGAGIGMCTKNPI